MSPDGFESIEIDARPGIPRVAHSVVTTEFVSEAGHPPRQALDPVLTRFEERHKT